MGTEAALLPKAPHPLPSPASGRGGVILTLRVR